MARAARKSTTENRRETVGNVIPLNKEIAKPYEPTSEEAAALVRHNKRAKRNPDLPKMKCDVERVGDAITARLATDHADPTTAYHLIADALNTSNMPFVYGWLKEASGLGMKAQGDIDIDQMNYGIAIATGIKPRDNVEAMLALQMAAVHMATMKAAATLGTTTTAKSWALYESSVNKLGRTFTTQMEALKRYRGKGNQRIVVERVNVSEGGQAIVGNVAKGESE